MRGVFFNLQVDDLEEAIIDHHTPTGRYVSIQEEKENIKQSIRHEKDIILGMISSKDLGPGVCLEEIQDMYSMAFNQYRPDLGQFIFNELFKQMNKDGEIFTPGMDQWKVVP